MSPVFLGVNEGQEETVAEADLIRANLNGFGMLGHGSPALRRTLARIDRPHAVQGGQPRRSIARALDWHGEQTRFPKIFEPALLLASEDLVVDVVLQPPDSSKMSTPPPYTAVTKSSPSIPASTSSASSSSASELRSRDSHGPWPGPRRGFGIALGFEAPQMRKKLARRRYLPVRELGRCQARDLVYSATVSLRTKPSMPVRKHGRTEMTLA